MLSSPSASGEAHSKENGDVGEGDFGAREGDVYEVHQAGPKWGFGLKIGTFDAPPDAILETGWQGSVHNPRAQKRAQVCIIFGVLIRFHIVRFILLA